SDILSKLGPVDMTDAFLLRFLRSQKYRMPDSLAKLERYASFAREHNLENIPDNDPAVLEVMRWSVLQTDWNRRSKQGHLIMYMNGALFHKLVHGDPDRTERALWWLFERALMDPEIQRTGFVFILDLTKWSLSLRDLGKAVALEKRILHLVQGVLPIRLAGFYILNEGWLFDTLISIVKVFMVRANTIKR
ncbi:MAG: hypothetical protein SGCHY_004977, partial [Lobulomycetales sp.]